MDECILHTGHFDRNGYGMSNCGPTHRREYRKANPDIDITGLHLHHLCGVRACIKVEHLALLTSVEHRKLHLIKHCKRGHEVSITRDRYGACKPCAAIRARAYRARMAVKS